MTTNQFIAIAIAAFSVWGLGSNDTDEQPEPEDGKISPFSSKVKKILDACPFAEPHLQIEYLLSGDSAEEVTKKEMLRLGQNSNSVPALVQKATVGPPSNG